MTFFINEGSNKNMDELKNTDRLILEHEKFAQETIKKNRGFIPQAVISVKRELIPILIVDRRSIRLVISKIEKLKDLLDWVVIMYEGYSFIGKNREEAEKVIEKYGNLEEGYLSGDSNIKWIFSIEAYWRDRETGKFIKKMAVYEVRKMTFEFNRIYESDNFAGYLTLNI